MANVLYSGSLVMTADVSQAKAQLKDLQSSLDGLLKNSHNTSPLGLTKEINDALSKTAELKVALDQAINTNTGKLDLSKFSKQINASQIKDYAAALQNLGPAGDRAFAQLAQSIMSAEIPLKRTNRLLNDFKTTLSNTVKWQISSSIVNSLSGAIQHAYGYAKDLNKSLNDIRIVTGYSVDQMAKFAREANNAAKALSTTTTQYTDAALIYYQQGLAEKDIKARTDATIKMANVTGESARAVSDYMTAIWNNFDNGSKSLEYYADVMTALGAATASSTDEIAAGLEKFAAVSETVGLSYEYATAALATVTAETRQSADVVGNAFKTLFSRIQGLNLGETMEDGTTLNKYSAALDKVGISIKDTSGEVKDMDIILDELGNKWDTLGKDTQIALAQTVAGVRQYTQLIALMDNWDEFKINLSVAEGAEGTLDTQAQIYAESWEAASNRVKASFEDIYDSILNDKFFIKLTDTFGKFVDYIGNTVDALGGMGGVFSGLGVIATRVFGKEIAQSFRDLTYNADKAKQDALEMRKAITEAYAEKSSGNAGIVASTINQAGKDQADFQSKILEKQQELESQGKSITSQEQALLGIYQAQLQALEESNIEQAETVEHIKNQISGTERALNRQYTSSLTGLDKEEMEQELQIFSELEKKLKTSSLAYGEASAAADRFSDSWGEFTSKNVPFESLKDEINNFKNGLTKAGVECKILDQILDETFKLDTEENYEEFLKEINIALKEAGEKAENVKKQLSEMLQARGLETSNLDAVQGLYESMGAEEFKRALEAGDLDAFIKSLDEKLGKIKGRAYDAADGLMAFGDMISSVSMAINTCSGVIDTFNQAMEGEIGWGEALLSIFSSLVIAIPVFVSAFSKMNLEALKALFSGKAAAEGIDEIGDEAVESTVQVSGLHKELQKLNLTNLGTKLSEWGKSFKEALPALGKAGLLLAGIAIAIGTIAAVSAQINADAINAEKASKNAQELQNHFNELKSNFDSFKNTISSYDEAVNALEDLTEGTMEYNEALMKSNELAMELIETNSELADSYYVEKGLIKFNEGALELAQENQLIKLQQQQSQSMLADVSANHFSEVNQKTNIARDMYSNEGAWKATGNTLVAGAGGALTGAGIGAVIGSGFPVIGTIIGAALGLIVGGITSAVTGFSTNAEEAAIEAIGEHVAKSGDTTIFASQSEAEFAKALEEANLKFDPELISALWANKDAIENYSKNVLLNTKQDKLKREQAFKANNAGNAAFQNVQNQDFVTKYVLEQAEQQRQTITGEIEGLWNGSNDDFWAQYLQYVMKDTNIDEDSTTGSQYRVTDLDGGAVTLQQLVDGVWTTIGDENGLDEDYAEQQLIEAKIQDAASGDEVIENADEIYGQWYEQIEEGLKNSVDKEEMSSTINSILNSYLDSGKNPEGFSQISIFDAFDFDTSKIDKNTDLGKFLYNSIEKAKESWNGLSEDVKNKLLELDSEMQKEIEAYIVIDDETSLAEIERTIALLQEYANNNAIVLHYGEGNQAIQLFKEGNFTELEKLWNESPWLQQFAEDFSSFLIKMFDGTEFLQGAMENEFQNYNPGQIFAGEADAAKKQEDADAAQQKYEEAKEVYDAAEEKYRTAQKKYQNMPVGGGAQALTNDYLNDTTGTFLPNMQANLSAGASNLANYIYENPDKNILPEGTNLLAYFQEQMGKYYTIEGAYGSVEMGSTGSIGDDLSIMLSNALNGGYGDSDFIGDLSNFINSFGFTEEQIASMFGSEIAGYLNTSPKEYKAAEAEYNAAEEEYNAAKTKYEAAEQDRDNTSSEATSAEDRYDQAVQSTVGYMQAKKAEFGEEADWAFDNFAETMAEIDSSADPAEVKIQKLNEAFNLLNENLRLIEKTNAAEKIKKVASSLEGGDLDPVEKIQAMNDLKDAFNDFFNMNVDDSFIQENLEDIIAWANGSEEAKKKIEALVAEMKSFTSEELMIELGIDASNINADKIKTILDGFLAGQSIDPITLQVTGEANFGALFKALTILGVPLQQTADLLKSLGMSTLDPEGFEQLCEVLAEYCTLMAKVNSDPSSVTDEDAARLKELGQSLGTIGFNSQTPTDANADLERYSPSENTGSGSGGGSGKSSAETARDKQMKAIDDEIARSEKAREGKSPDAQHDAIMREIELLEEQQKILEEQTDQWKELMKAKVEAFNDKYASMGFEIELTDDGMIANLSELYGRLAVELEEAEDGSKEERLLENMMDDLDDAAQLQGQIDDNVASIADKEREQAEKALEDITQRIDWRVKQIDYQIELLNYYQEKLLKQAHGNKQTIEAMLEGFKYQEQEMLALFEKGDTLRQGISELNAAKAQYPDYAQMFDEQILEYQSDLIDVNMDILELRAEMEELVQNVLELALQEIDTQTQRIDKYVSMLDHFQNIIDLSGRTMLDQSLKVQIGTAKVETMVNKMGILKQQMEGLSAATKQAQDALAARRADNDESSVKFWENQVEMLKQELETATEEFLGSWEDVLEEAGNLFEMRVELAVQTMSDALSPFSSLELFQNNYNQDKTIRDQYLDDATRIYELNKLNRELNRAVTDENDLLAKSKLRDIQQQIYELQRSGVEMSQFDLEILQKKYDLQLAEIALMEAQNSKTSMRLIRDAAGNWTYAYDADEESIEDATQKYEDAIYELDQLAKEYIDDVSDQLIENQIEYKDALMDLDRNSADYQDQLLRLQEYYTNRQLYLLQELNKGVEESGIAFHDTLYGQMNDIYDYETAYDQFLTNSNTTVAELMTNYKDWQSVVEEAMNVAGTSWENFSGDMGTSLESMEDYIKALCDEISKLVDVLMSYVSTSISMVEEWQEKYSKMVDENLAKNEAVMNTDYINGGQWVSPSGIGPGGSSGGSSGGGSRPGGSFGGGTSTYPISNNNNNNSIKGNNGNFVGGIDYYDNPYIQRSSDATSSEYTQWSGELNHSLSAIEAAELYMLQKADDVTDDLDLLASAFSPQSGWCAKWVADIIEATEGDVKRGNAWDMLLANGGTPYDGTKPQNGSIVGYASNSGGYGHVMIYQDGYLYGTTGEDGQVGRISWEDYLAKGYESTRIAAPTNTEAGEQAGSLARSVYVQTGGSPVSLPDDTCPKCGKRLSDCDCDQYDDNPYNDDPVKPDDDPVKPFDTDRTMAPDGTVIVRTEEGREYYKNGKLVLKDMMFDTGGYTGEWGPEGKLAWLHEKELVLNKKDTDNILDAVSIARSIDSLIYGLTSNTNWKLSNLIGQINPMFENTPIEQRVQINAEFPGVTDQYEIQEAFANLTNDASQYLNLNKY